MVGYGELCGLAGNLGEAMTTYSYFDLGTLLLTGDSVTTSLSPPSRPGMGVVLGRHDHLGARVAAAEGGGFVVVKEAPPAPPGTEWTEWTWDFTAARWAPRATDAAKNRDVRSERARRLAECDWVVTKAKESDEPVPAAWRAYRKALRDVPEQAGFPHTVEWPTIPS